MDYLDWQIRAATDADFRNRLIAEPEATLAEIGVEVPAGVAVRVAESTPEEFVVSIPPMLTEGVELDEDALAETAAGSTPVCLTAATAAAAVTAVGVYNIVTSDYKPKVQGRRPIIS